MSSVDLVAVLASLGGGFASVCTGGYVFLTFRRLFAVQDQLARSLESLGRTLNDLKVEVVGGYVSYASCRECRKDFKHRLGRLEEEVHGGQKSLSDMDGRLVKVETAFDAHQSMDL